ncbi:MAG: DUF3572 domain-containing protein [Pseudomonadota bacterium]
MQREDAETVALQALAWVVGNEDLLPVFLGSTGASASDLRERAGDPEFMGAVLDFLIMDDAWIASFCQASGFAPEAPVLARQALPGGNLPHWT